MSEYLFPTPGSGLKSLLDYKAKTGGVFSEKEAAIDIMLALDKGNINSERHLAKRWSWSASKVHRNKSILIEKAGQWRRFERVKQTEAEVKQPEAKIGQKSIKKAHIEAEVKQPEAEVKQPVYIYPRATDTELQITDKKNLNKPIPSAKNKKTAKVFSRDSWQHQFSTDHFEFLKQLNVAPKAALKNEQKTLEKGAAEFDKINRLDGYSQDDIKLVLCWLLKEDNWWIQSGNYASVTKLRKSKDGQRYFERFLIQAKKQNGRTGKQSSRKARPAANAGEVARIYDIALEAASDTPGGSAGGDDDSQFLGFAANGGAS